MYGTTPLPEILPEVRKIGAAHLDVWPRVHGDQREQIEEMGHQKFAGHLESSGVKLGMITQYKLGPFGLKPEMPIARKFGASILISGAHGPKNLEGSELKAAVQSFLERMRPHIDAAERHGLVIGIENHGGSLLSSPDSIRWFGELAPSRNIGVALAPYHLPEDPELVASLVRDLGQNLVHFYAWQHGKGCSKKLPKAEELEQMPGRGRMDFKPIVRALGDVNYKGWTEIFMHPVPRGIPILEKTSEVTAEINRARAYLDGLIAKI